MADSDSNRSLDNESVEETSPKAALSTSFTISFEDENQSVFKQKKIIKTANMFVRRHVRTLSLPIGNAYVPNQNNHKSSCDGREANNLSLNEESDIQRTDSEKDVEHTKKYLLTECDNLKSKESVNGLRRNGNCEKETVSDSESEGGTYTLDKGNEEVVVARKSIDQVFGISPTEKSNNNIPKMTHYEKNDQKKNRTRMVDEWIEQSATAMKTAKSSSNVASVVTKPSLKNKVTSVSKIPSPVFGRRDFGFKESDVNLNLKECSARSSSSGKNSRSTGVEPATLEQPVNSPTNGDIDTVSYLKETENIVAALHDRLQSDLKHCDESDKEVSVDKYSNTRFNRAFSLRRDRLKKPATSVTGNSTIPVRTTIPIRKNSISKCVASNSRAGNTNGYTPPITEKKTNTLRVTKPSSAPVCRSKEQTKADNVKKKTYQRPKTSGGIRSNSSLSAQEIEFQNWKRRKSYDPLKAAAEDRKKKSMMQSVGSASVSTAALTKVQKAADRNDNDEKNEMGIMRSASFHGLRNKSGYERCVISGENISRSASSRFVPNENSNSPESFNNLDDDDWIIPKPPSTSLQNTPPESVSSKLSLLSHGMSSSSVVLSSSSNTKVNFMTLLSVTELTREIRSTVSSVMNSLRCGFENSDECSVSQKQNGYSLESKTECSENSDLDTEENTFYPDNDFDLDEDCIPDTGDDDSKSNDLSGNYQLNIALNNLRQVQDAVQKLQLFCANR